MSKKVNLGGDRLGSGAKMDVHLHGYERSTHDLSSLWRSTMAAGTLVPFMKLLALPGDNFQINLNADVKTLPTIGPLFGSFKLQLDVFQIPIRLYNAGLHMNRLKVGLDMSKVLFPVFNVRTYGLGTLTDLPVEQRQINQSSLLAYLGIRGNGVGIENDYISRVYNGVPILAYWDIYKNYYANVQEDIGSMLGMGGQMNITSVLFDSVNITVDDLPVISGGNKILPESVLEVYGTNIELEDIDLKINVSSSSTGYGTLSKAKSIFSNYYKSDYGNGITRLVFMNPNISSVDMYINWLNLDKTDENLNTAVVTFPLDNIDTMRDNIMKQSFNSAYVYGAQSNATSFLPYSALTHYVNAATKYWNMSSMNGLALKTYQSDIFNNWLNTEWIEGTSGVNNVTAIDVSSGSFTIDTLNLSKKVYDMLNRVAVSGGSYQDWISAVYGVESGRRAESPIYLGGLSKEIIFQEVVSNSNVDYEGSNEPLGSLAGRGVLASKHKGGYIDVRIDEASYIMGIVSITPRVDYSQGNDWDVEFRHMNQLHKPALDEIGFQDLVTTQMAFWERHGTANNPTLYSAGKQPAWINYMTDVNKTYGHFADSSNQMFMTLNRRFEMDDNYRIKDLTTYIDPKKFNYIFADTMRDAQNFWVQISKDITARRKMSAKVMPNL